MTTPGPEASAAPAAEGSSALRAWLRPGWHWLRHAPERALHHRRRRAALRALERHGPPEAVVFVCQGNIFRSPYAAAVMSALLSPEWRARVRIASAGFVGPGRPVPEDAQALAAERSLDLGAHRSQCLAAPLLAGRTLCVVMDPAQIRRVRATAGNAGQRVLNLGDLDPEPITTRAVPDPWSGSQAVLRSSYARIDRCVLALVAALGAPPGE